MSLEQQLGKLILEKRKFIFLSIILFAIASIGVTFFIPKKYTSNAIVYPTKTNSIAEIVESPEFGYEIHTDRLIQLFKSQIIKDSVMNKFNLIDYYELDTNSSNWRYHFNKNYEEDIIISKTKYLSVSIEVTTESPSFSADIANYLVSTIDLVREAILKKNSLSAFNSYQSKFLAQKSVVDSLLNQIYNLPNPASYSNDKLLERRKQEIAQNNKNGNYTEIDGIIQNMKGSSGKAGELLINEYYFEKGRLNHLKGMYQKSKEKVESSVPKIFVVSNAVANPKKTYPSFLLNLIIGIGLGLFSSLLYVLLTNKLEELNGGS